MEGGDGMVAVVHGLRDAGLAVTLLEGTTQYTLMPSAVSHQPEQKHVSTSYSHKSSQDCESSEGFAHAAMHCDTGAQATDGRYASVYKMAHCNITPTSPPVQLTEFPPQRTEVCRGHGNFEVGGSGSGETTYSPTRVNGSYRGGMSWPDRGAVCTPRHSHEPDAFANSLRKYPSISSERSAEIVERLISYSQAKSTSKSKGCTSPTRNLESNPSSQTLERNFSRNSMSRSPQWAYEPEVNVRARLRTEESPTRDGKPKKNSDCECWDRKPIFTRNYDVRCLKDVSRREKEHTKNTTYSTNSVNIEIQAAVPMVSKEVSTLPRIEPSRRTVAVPLSPISSNADRTQEGESKRPANQRENTSSFKYVQTTFSYLDLNKNLREYIHTSSSSTKISKLVQDNDYSLRYSRKSKSQEELRRNNDSIPEKILKLLNYLSFYPDMRIPDKVLHRNEDFYNKGCKYDEKNKIKFGRCVKKVPILHSREINCRKLSEQITNQFFTKKSRRNTIRNALNPNVFRAELSPFRITNEKLDGVIKECMNEVPIKSYDFLGRKVDKAQVVNTVTNQLRYLFSTSKLHNDSILKNYVINILEEVPIKVHVCCNKINYLNTLADQLVKKIKKCVDYNRLKTQNIYQPCHNNNMPYIYKKYIQPTEEELKEFVREELAEFFEKSHLKICSERLKDIEIELIDILIDSMEAIHFGNDEKVKEEIVTLLCEKGKLSEYQAVYLTNVVLENITEMFNVVDKEIQKPESQAFVVLQNTIQNTLRQNKTNLNDMSDFSISGITDGDINANLDLYIVRLTEQIDKWLTNILGPPADDNGFREVVINDLAGDIVDRLKYLEINPSNRGTDADELEHLKYQIFKWINKLVGDDNVATINHASQLMQRIQSIPVPMLTIPQQDVNSSLPLCCQIDTNLSPRGGSMTEPHQNASSSVSKKSGLRGLASTIKRRNFESSHMPVLESSAPGEVMVKTTNRKDTSNIKQSSPSAFSTMSNNEKVNEKSNMSQISMFGTPAPGESMQDNSGQKATSERRFVGSDAIASKPMQSNDKGRTSLSQMPIFGQPDPGGSMIEAPHSGTSNRRSSAPAKFSSEPMGTGNMDQRTSFRPVGDDATIEVSRQASPRRLSSPGRLNYAKNSCRICSRGTNQSPSAKPSMKQLNEEYDEYVKNWVQQVPIATSSPGEEALAEKARLGMYNGIWKAIAKLKLNPATFHNLFYYQDLLDDEIEELFNCLPQTPEMISKKHLLKAQLIEKTTHTTELILTSAAPASLRQEIVQNISNNLPRANVVDSIEKAPPAQLYEELQKLNLAEDFILYTSFKEDDKVKANVYRKKLLKTVEELVEVLKKSQGKDLKDIDAGIYIDDVMSALHKVPLPSQETIREEADEILLGIEIEQWFSDLPLVPNDDYLEQLFRRRYRNALAKKIHEMENEINFADSNSERELKHEIRKFLESLPLQDGQNVNKEFMVEELVNRLNNRSRDLSGECRWKSVAFGAPLDYEDFSKRMPLCSSYAELPPDQQSSYMILGGTRVKDTSHYYQMKFPETVDSGQQWLTIKDSQAPPCHHNYSYQTAGDRAISGKPDNSALKAPLGVQVPQQDQKWLTIEDSRAQFCGICSQRGVLPNRKSMSRKPDNSPFKQYLQASLGHKSQMPYVDIKQAASPQQEVFQDSQVVEQSQIPCSEYQKTPGKQVSSQKLNTVQGSQIIGGSYQDLASIEMQRSCTSVTHQQTSVQGIQETPLYQAHSGGGTGHVNACFVEQKPCSPRRTSQVSTIRPIMESQKPCSTSPDELYKSGNIIHTKQGSEFHRSINEEGYRFTDLSKSLAQATSSASISIYDQHPVGFSTPQQVISQGTAPRPGRKRARETGKTRRDAVRKRLELEDLEEEEQVEQESDEVRCSCMERSWRCRKKRTMCCSCDDFDMDCLPCLPIRYPICQYFY